MSLRIKAKAFVKTLEDPSPSVVQAHKNIYREVQAERDESAYLEAAQATAKEALKGLGN